MRHVFLFFVTGVTVATVLTGCSGGSPADEENLSWDDSPLSEYFFELRGSAVEAAAQQLKFEEAVAVCMKEQGFEYTPYVDPAVSMEPDSSVYETEEWASQYGYGVFTEPPRSEGSTDPVDDSVDPNWEYREGLSGSEGEVYDEALHGLADKSASDEGCYASASASEDPLGSGEGKALKKEITELYDRFYEDPVFVEIEEDWASCMAEAGYAEFTEQNDAVDKFWAKRDALSASFDLNSAEGKEWRELEIETALADFKCRKNVGYEQRPLRLKFELEEQFIKDHQAQLDAVREIAKQRRQETK